MNFFVDEGVGQAEKSKRPVCQRASDPGTATDRVKEVGRYVHGAGWAATTKVVGELARNLPEVGAGSLVPNACRLEVP